MNGSWQHIDLWLDVAILLRRRDVRLRWIKGHLSGAAADTAALQQDRWGNVAADALAGHASRGAEAAQKVYGRWRRHMAALALRVHRSMVDVVLRRSEILQA